MSGNHTPTPWKVVQRPNFENGYIYTSIQPVTPDPETMRHMLMASGEYYICDTIHTPVASKAEKYRANADFIVIAVNSYASSQAEIERLRTLAERYESALKRIRDATPLNTNSADAANMCNWTYAVSSTALIDASLSGSKE
jgi:hypothetical protein